MTALRLAMREITACVSHMLIAWTTVPTKALATQLAASAVKAGLAVCVQVEGPIESHYRWEGIQEKTEEYRLMFKVLPSQGGPLETWVHSHHPYQTPEWVVIKAEHVAEKYLSWAQAKPNNLPL
jgi:periplasmic divalent cation tolerance protein